MARLQPYGDVFRCLMGDGKADTLGSMPRAMRVEYPGAIYHVMDRGDRREDIFVNDVDRQDLLKTLAEACLATAIRPSLHGQGAPSRARHSTFCVPQRSSRPASGLQIGENCSLTPPPSLWQGRAMLGETKNQFSLTRGGNGRGKKSKPISMMRFEVWLFLSLACMASAIASIRIQAAEYLLTALQTPPGVNRSYGYAINNQGQAVGNYLAPSLVTRAFIYSGGAMTDLGALGVSGANACSVNDYGQVAGFSASSNNFGFTRGFLYENGSLTDLGALINTISYGYGINNRKQIVGNSFYGPGGGRAFLWANGGMSELGVLAEGITSAAYAINDNGLVVGQSDTTGDAHRAFLYSGQGMLNLGTLPGGDESSATAINLHGQVVGWSSTTTGKRAFLWSQGTGMINLGSLTGGATGATGINKHGQVVGWEQRTNGLLSAFIWTEQAGMRDLNDLLTPNTGWRAEIARGINDFGQVIGEGSYLNGNTRAVLLSPVFTNLNVYPTHLSAGTGFRLAITGPAEQPCQILGSGNPVIPLSQWTVLATGPLTNGFWYFSDSQSQGLSRRFYLVRGQ
jgi:probable HAF family extracellular repeat protein